LLRQSLNTSLTEICLMMTKLLYVYTKWHNAKLKFEFCNSAIVVFYCSYKNKQIPVSLTVKAIQWVFFTSEKVYYTISPIKIRIGGRPN